MFVKILDDFLGCHLSSSALLVFGYLGEITHLTQRKTTAAFRFLSQFPTSIILSLYRTSICTRAEAWVAMAARTMLAVSFMVCSSRWC